MGLKTRSWVRFASSSPIVSSMTATTTTTFLHQDGHSYENIIKSLLVLLFTRYQQGVNNLNILLHNLQMGQISWSIPGLSSLAKCLWVSSGTWSRGINQVVHSGGLRALLISITLGSIALPETVLFTI
jgi:hypothetical protein